MIVLLCGEGRTDCGDPNFWDSRSRSNISTEGWMQPIIKKIDGFDGAQFEVKYRGDLTLFDPHRRVPAGVTGHGQKAFMAKCAAVREECDIVVYMVDADDVSLKRHREIVGEIISGFSALRSSNVGCVACVPVSASESWLLSDQVAWNALSEKHVLNLPNHPEQIWGAKHDTFSNRPHNLFLRICTQENLPDSSDTRAQLARLMDIDTLKSRCPISFPDFYKMLVDPLIFPH